MRLSKNRRLLVFLLILLVIILASGAASALSTCPKGKVNCTDPCHDFIDKNGNGICDLSESSTSVSSSTTSSSSGSTSANPTSPSSLNNSSNLSSQSSTKASSKSTTSVSSQSTANTSSQTTTSTQDQLSVSSNNTVQSDSILKALVQPQFVGLFLLCMFAFAASKKLMPAYSRQIILSISLVYLGFYLKGCICPVGVLANLPLHIQGILNGQYNLWLILFLLPIILTLFAGRIYCGGVCPFGAVQEFIYKAGSKLKFNNSKPGISIVSWPKYIKYLMLLGILLITPIIGSAWWCQIDPFGYLFNFSGTSIALTLLIILLVFSIFISRPWCRFICPYGAMLGIISKDVDLLKKTAGKAFGRYNDSKISCGKCNKCDSKCPVSAYHKGCIDIAECINCGSCKRKCLKLI